MGEIMKSHDRILAVVASLMILAASSLCGDDSLLVATLRSKLKYRFILDYLESKKPHIYFFGEKYSNKVATNPDYFDVIEPPFDSTSLEEFTYFLNYSLRRVASLQTNEQYYLLSTGETGSDELFLFDNDTSHAILLD